MFLKKNFKIGIVAEDLKPYYEAWASTRLRVYDVISMLKGSEYRIELFQESKTKEYDCVVFMKVFSKSYIQQAKDLKVQNPKLKIVLDINTNILDAAKELEKINVLSDEKKKEVIQQNEDIIEMLKVVDHVIVVSNYLKEHYSKFHQSVFYIPESISDEFLKELKVHKDRQPIKIAYVGYVNKAVEIFMLKDILIELSKKYKIELLFISDEDPKIDFIKSHYIKYNQKTLYKTLQEADFKIAPRDLSLKYNLGHSFTKAAYPMSVGLPVLASPVPAYINTEVVINNTLEDWKLNLEKFITDAELRKYIGKRSQDFVRRNFSVKAVREDYINFFSYILNNDKNIY